MNVYKLSANQDTLMHVVDESLSILNVSRMEIKENRQRINDLLMLIGSVEDKVINIFHAYSLPGPLLGRTRVDRMIKKLLAYYKLESNYWQSTQIDHSIFY